MNDIDNELVGNKYQLLDNEIVRNPKPSVQRSRTQLCQSYVIIGKIFRFPLWNWVGRVAKVDSHLFV